MATINGTTPDDIPIENFGAAGASLDLTFDSTNAIGLARGTRIATIRGEFNIEDLAIGDRVITSDRGYQPIRWIGSTTVPAFGELAPIRFSKNSIGNIRTLIVSPSHRILLNGMKISVLFGDNEVIASAKHLINGSTITRQESPEIEYFHMLFDVHELVYAEGIRTESFHLGLQEWGTLAKESQTEILSIFPKLSAPDFLSYGPTVRRSINAYETLTVD